MSNDTHKPQSLVETQEISCIELTANDSAAWCPTCQLYQPVVSLDATAVICGVGIVEVARLVEQGHIHSVASSDGNIRVCAKSLAR